jgi:hypothetical protein
MYTNVSPNGNDPIPVLTPRTEAKDNPQLAQPEENNPINPVPPTANFNFFDDRFIRVAVFTKKTILIPTNNPVSIINSISVSEYAVNRPSRMTNNA